MPAAQYCSEIKTARENKVFTKYRIYCVFNHTTIPVHPGLSNDSAEYEVSFSLQPWSFTAFGFTVTDRVGVFSGRVFAGVHVCVHMCALRMRHQADGWMGRI